MHSPFLGPWKTLLIISSLFFGETNLGQNHFQECLLDAPLQLGAVDIKENLHLLIQAPALTFPNDYSLGIWIKKVFMV